MSICRTTIVELHSEEDADVMTADYIANFESMFPECEKSINSSINIKSPILQFKFKQPDEFVMIQSFGLKILNISIIELT